MGYTTPVAAGFAEVAVYCRPVDITSLTSSNSPYLYEYLDSWAVPYVMSLVDVVLGPWPAFQGADSILWCQLWECDGLAGCNAAFDWLPDPSFGDDLLGSALLSVRDFEPAAEFPLVFWESGVATAEAVISCPQVPGKACSARDHWSQRMACAARWQSDHGKRHHV